MRSSSATELLNLLAHARSVATLAGTVGITILDSPAGPPRRHLGAILADAVLQAGLNYRTVVRARVERVERNFPEAATLSGIIAVVETGGLSEFLLWSHPVKLARFSRLVALLRAQNLEGVDDLRAWLQTGRAREILLRVNGIGPKTVDYLCCLVGLDRIPVDRHLKAFARDAGVATEHYDSVQAIMSFAADLLGVRRRDFDASIWKYVSAKNPQQTISAELQPNLLDTEQSAQLITA